MRDARGARGDGEHADGAVVCGCGSGGRGGCSCSRFLGGLFLGELLAFLVVDQLEEFLGAARGEQLVAPVDVHEHRHEACEHLEMHLAVARGGDHEDQLAGLSVGRLVVDAVGDGDRCQGGFRNRVGLGMRNGHALADCRGAAGLAGENRLAVHVDIAQVAGSIVKADELIDSIALRRYRYP